MNPKSRFGPKGWTPEQLGSLTGKTYLVTGANQMPLLPAILALLLLLGTLGASWYREGR